MLIRPATADDIPTIVGIYAADELVGKGRESFEDMTPYYEAFDRLAADPHQLLVVAELDGQVVGTFQLTVIAGVARRGITRALIESVHVSPEHRSHGIGGEMMRWAIDEARKRGCQLAQLTSNNARPEAHRFYERLGFRPTHVGFKLVID
jgi:GNAT superfamily N-acetyltransferase